MPKEIQRLITVACLASLPRRESSSVKKTDLEAEVFQLFHGKNTDGDPNLDKKLPAKDACPTDMADPKAALTPGDSFVSMFFEGRSLFASAFPHLRASHWPALLVGQRGCGENNASSPLAAAYFHQEQEE
jgi:hypothetical protein